jgi:hypothetical protein
LKTKRKANLYCSIELQECAMAQLGNTQVEDKKEKQVFRCTIELQKCTTLEPRNTLVQNKKKKKPLLHY